MMTPDVRTIAELVRAPAALTVPGDVLAGAAATGWPYGRRTMALTASSVCLYWAGMALNDYADRELDSVERPERPIPSGRVSPRFALGLAAGLTAAGVGLAGVVGGRSALAVAIPLAGTVWAYDLALKDTPAGPTAMAAARALDVLLGAGGRCTSAALQSALAVGTHTYGVTALSRGEVHGASRQLPLAALAVTAGVTASVIGRRGGQRWAATALASTYAATVAVPQLDAVRHPTAAQVRRAVGAGILGLLPLQAALAARSGSVIAAASAIAAFPLARRLSRKVSPT